MADTNLIGVRIDDASQGTNEDRAMPVPAGFPAPLVDAAESGASATRRTLLGAGIGALVATIASALGRPQGTRGANGNPLTAGTEVSATLPTTVSNHTNGADV